MLTLTSVPKFNGNILKRYEENIDGGTFFVYNVELQTMWYGNYSSYLLLRNINGANTISEICLNALPYFPDLSVDKLNELALSIINELHKQDYISVKQDDENFRLLY